ncbi:MAG: hypothetical protein ACYDEY_02830 [Acidimicrobiales bacterium]
MNKSPTTVASKRKRHPRKRERGSSTHVINQALRPTLAHLATVNKRLDAGRRVYNACLGESLARCNHMRADSSLRCCEGVAQRPVQVHGLIQTRIVRNMIRGRPSLRAQFVVDGCSPIRHETGTGTISADVGPSIMSVVVADAEHNPVPEAIGHRVLAESIKDIQAELRRLQRHLDRQHRAGSPQCFDEHGQHKKTCAWWKNRSKAAQHTLVQIAELHRCIAATRTTLHGKLVNEVLAYGVNVRSEALNYATWQEMYPRSVRDSSVGEAMALLFHKAENAGGKAYHYATRTTALSQTCVWTPGEETSLATLAPMLQLRASRSTGPVSSVPRAVRRSRCWS